MMNYILRRFLYMIPLMILISILSFTVIKLQPGEFGSQYFSNPRVSPETVENLRARLGLDQPAYMQYLTWVKGIITEGDFGYSFAYKRPVAELIWERMGWTVVVAGSTILFTWVLAIPIGIFSATHKYSIFDYVFTFIGFIGISVPNFFMALLLMYLVLSMGGTEVGGLFSQQYIGAPWSIAKVIDLLKHIWIPLIAIGTAGMAGILRQMRGNLLDILGEQYVQTARAKGLNENVVIYKHAVRNAINPLISMFGMQLPKLISGTIISAIVLNLPTMGPFFYDALINQDQYLVMTFLMFSAFMMLIGNLIADLLLALVDPRIRLD
ncbi:peptide/nickel transport system permease protein [Halanaerobium saccharolyticum]|uniref:Peptide/nickel transport system permease protein n=1 Tax=Halanaerobium saccharolyticum TaxID=43595 RepID=A0A4V3CY02_9FIRM|nr:ABC transporter permease [Halanaerobium saccharolyticum]TDP92248.1 peptide/nickel transport system permease protein [Halanaerobium saccharolyticum]